MNSDACSTQPEVQLSLFDLGNWLHSTHTIQCYANPLPGVARLVLGQVPLYWLTAGRPVSHNRPVAIHWAAVDHSGWLLVAQTQRFDGDSQTFFQRIAGCVESAQENLRAAPTSAPHNVGGADLTTESLFDRSRWLLQAGQPASLRTIPNLWVLSMSAALPDSPHKSSAPDPAGHLATRLEAVVGWLMGGLRPELKQAMQARPNLPYASALAMYRTAQSSRIADALQHATQALRTLPLFVLRDAAEEGSGRVAREILAGSHLPEVMCTRYGLTRALWRHIARQAAEIPDTADFRVVLKALRHTEASRWPVGGSQWARLLALADSTRAASNELGHHEDASRMRAVVAGAARLHLGASSRLQSPARWRHSVAGELTLDAQDVARATICLETLRAEARELMGSDPSAMARSWVRERLIPLGARVLGNVCSGVRAHVSCAALLEELPELPDIQDGCWTFRPLRALDEIVRVGKRLGNCTQAVDYVQKYLLEGRILFSIHDPSDAPTGMAAFRCSLASDGRTAFALAEIEGRRNQRAFLATTQAARRVVKLLERQRPDMRRLLGLASLLKAVLHVDLAVA